MAAVPLNLYQNVVVRWAIPSGITSELYDTTNIYRSGTEAQNYTFLSSIPFVVAGVPQTQYVDITAALALKDSYFYNVLFSHSMTGLLSTSYLAYKALTPREQRILLQLRDALSRFITNRLADEEIRQYMQEALQALNIYSPTTTFNFFSLPEGLEPLVILGALIFGIIKNMLGIGFTDISYSDQGFSLAASRMDKMTTALDKIVAQYNGLLAIAKLEYAEGGEGVGTIALPIGMGGNLNRGIMNVFDLLSAVGR